MVPQLSVLFIMEPLSLPNQREPCKVEKIVLVLPYSKKCPGTPRLEKCPGTPRLKKCPGTPRLEKCPGTPILKNMSWYPQIGKMSWYPHANKLLQKCVIFNKAINLHSRGLTEQHFYVWEPHRWCCL